MKRLTYTFDHSQDSLSKALGFESTEQMISSEDARTISTEVMKSLLSINGISLTMYQAIDKLYESFKDTKIEQIVTLLILGKTSPEKYMGSLAAILEAKDKAAARTVLAKFLSYVTTGKISRVIEFIETGDKQETSYLIKAAWGVFLVDLGSLKDSTTEETEDDFPFPISTAIH